MKQKIITTIGSALVDVFIHSDQFELDTDAGELVCRASGGKLEVESFELRTGGGASNTAVGFARMGFEARCVAEMGHDELAALVLAELAQDGVSQDFVIQEKREKTGGSVILVTKSGDRMVLVHRGAASMLDVADVPARVVAESDWLHVSSISSQFETLEHIFQLAREHGKKLSWNPGRAFLGSLSERSWDIEQFPVEILFLNQQEWQQAAAVQQRLRTIIPQIVITNSDKGGVLIRHDHPEFTFSAVKTTAVDTTGAGDAFAVGYVSAYLHGHAGEVGVEWGAKNAASVVQQVGAKPGLLKNLE